MTIFKRLLRLCLKHFKFTWCIITILIAVLALHYNLQVTYKRSYKEVMELTRDLSKKVDGFFEDLFQEIYTLPLPPHQLTNCTQELMLKLEHIILNSPYISGLIINNDNKALCSTVQGVQYTHTEKPRSMIGPLSVTMFDQPIYLIRQKMSTYEVDLLVVSSLLKNVLETNPTIAGAVILYDQLQQKKVIEINYDSTSKVWQISPSLNKALTDNTKMYVVDKLESVDGLLLKVLENTNTVTTKIWFTELLTLLFTLFISYILYLLINFHITKHYSLHRAMKIALRQKRFYPVYQPLFDANNNTFSSVEILLRWKQASGKVIMPDSFIDKAESSGLIVPITLQILETAFNEFNEFQTVKAKFHLSINLSVAHFTSSSFFKQFIILKNQFNIDARQIIFEITERDLLDKNDVIFVGKMKELRAAGFSLAIDDYGTGHASISYLQYFPFNYLKIDKLFIQAIGTKAITESLNDAIIHMAKSLNLIIIAEGVETQEQVDYLTKNEVRYLQGWYFSKAVSIDKIKELILGKNNEI